MHKLSKKYVDKFGEESVSYVSRVGDTYAIIRECDNIVLAYGKELKGW